MEIIKSYIMHPIVIGLLTLCITYLSMYYKEKQKRIKNSDIPKQQVNITIPCMVGLLCWFLSSSYFDNNTDLQTPRKVQHGGNLEINNANSNVVCVKSNNSVSSHTFSDNSRSYHFIKKGDIIVPDIDVFLDVGGF